MKKRFLTLLTVLAIAMTFTFAFAMADGGMCVEAKSKKYSLPVSSKVVWYDDSGRSSVDKAKYDKYGNLKYALVAEAIPMKYTIKYRNKKGAISKISFGDGTDVYKKFYNKKGIITKTTFSNDVFKYATDKKGIIKKVTRNGKLYYKVKSIKFHKNGFAKKVVYNNGNVNNYNSDGLLTSAVSNTENGDKYTYKYTKKGGKIVKIIEKRNGKNFKKVTLKYGKSSTKDVWKYSCAMNFAGAPSNACELYGKASLSGVNW